MVHGMGPHGPRLGGKFPGEFHPQEGPLPRFKMGGRREPGFGGYAAGPDPRAFPDGMGPHHGGGDGFGRNGRRDDFGNGRREDFGNGRRDDFGMGGPSVNSPGRRYPEEFRGGQM